MINPLNLAARRDGPSFTMRVSEYMFFTARFARATEFAEEKYIFFSAERAEKKMIYDLVIRENHSRAIETIYLNKIVMWQ